MESSFVAQDSKNSRKVRRVKTFTGCWGCRSRKIKCDEATPECSQCQKAGVKCAGYESTLVWILPGQKSYPAGRRRALRYDLTWSRSPSYGSDDIDALIVQCDIPDSEQLAQPSNISKTAGPFTVFPIMAKSKQLHPDIDRAMRLTPTPRLLAEPDDSASYLLHHYTTHIAPNMMPFNDSRNPWQSSYPLLARCGDTAGHKSLYHAILAQAAGNLAHLGVERELNKASNMENYAKSIEYLRVSLSSPHKDFSIALASMLTLVMSEHYNGQPNVWRLHLNGAWDLLRSSQSQKPWLDNDFAWVTTQSLCLLKIKSGSTTQDEQDLISSVAERSDFGFTTGATPELLACIMEINSLHDYIKQNRHMYGMMDDPKSMASTSSNAPSLLVTSPSSSGLQRSSTSGSSGGPLLSASPASSTATYDSSLSSSSVPLGPLFTTIKNLIHRIEQCVLESTEAIVHTHQRIFLLGTLIYAHRQLLNPPPFALFSHLSSLLDCVALYPTLGGGHTALWPVFMAAVEVYLPEHKQQVREWMDRADQIGVASRTDVHQLIKRIWATREQMADDEGIEECEIVLSWSVIMNEMGLDIVLS
ncbi:hypothetical protein G7Y79_00018g045230 [Physcia stellaris]|nr:hypothetical protein G7Y79_00018g045230 [Physcia stellaris]